MKKLIIDLIGIGLTALLLACCSSDKSKAPVSNFFDETNLSEGEKMILAARNEYNLSRVLALCDSLEKTGDISPVAANFYHGGALIYSGKMGEAQQYLEKAIADSMPDATDLRLYLRAKKIAAGFGGGVGRLRMMCGAVSGIVMLVGLDCGQTEGSDQEGKSACYKVVQDLLARSKADNGSLICAEILGIKGYEKVPCSYVASERTAEYYKKRPCAAKVESAARIFADYLKEKQTT